LLSPHVRAHERTPDEAARVTIPTPVGEFDVHAFEPTSGHVYLAMVRGDIGSGRDVLVRVHSECLTGDVMGSLRCDCGPQLRAALRAIAAEGRGVLVYATGQEGRGIGLVAKLRAYMLQDDGADTFDANRQLGFPADAREFGEAAAVLATLGVRSVRLLTNNPSKVQGLRVNGIEIGEVVPLPTAPHARNVRYLRTKRDRFHHRQPSGPELNGAIRPAIDATSLLGSVDVRGWRPYVAVKFAQTLDGRIATSSGDSKWISGEEERRISHALRAACDAVLVGVGTVTIDDPQLTVRMVEGPSPIRVVLDTTLRAPPESNVFSADAHTVVITTERSAPDRRLALLSQGAQVVVVGPSPGGSVDLRAALRVLRSRGIRSLLVEGGASTITSFLSHGLADRLIVGIAPSVMGSGLDAVGDLSVGSVRDGIRLSNREVHVAGDDLLIAGDIDRSPSGATLGDAG
jgi:3,4-dihydroxy 2-butanone 4-phosphate synthase/GTP cyclohydrolase II